MSKLYKKVWVLERKLTGEIWFEYEYLVNARGDTFSPYPKNKPMKILPDANAVKTFNTEEEAGAFAEELAEESDIERYWQPTEVFIEIK